MKDLELLQKRFEREVRARKQAEGILEKKALELFTVNEQLKALNNTKDELLDAVSKALTTLFQYNDLNVALKSSLNILGPKAKVNLISILVFKSNSDELIPIDNFEWNGTKTSSLLSKIKSKKNKYKKFIDFCDEQFSISDSKYYESDRLITEELSYLDINTAVIFPVYNGITLDGLLIFELLDKTDIETEPFQSLLRAFSAGVQSAFEIKSSKNRIGEQKQFYESVLNSIPSDLVVFDKDHTYKFINPIAVKDPKTRSWMIGKDDFDYVKHRNKPIEIAKKRRAVFDDVKKTGKPSFFEEKHIDPQGEEEWKHRILYPVKDSSSSEIEMVIGYAIDITDIKKTQQEKESISTRLSTLITNLNSGVLLEDEARNILITNEDFCSIFEIPSSPYELVGVNCANSAEQSKHLVVHPKKFVDRINSIVSKRKACLNEEIVFKNGKVFERDFIPIYQDNKYLGHLWEYRDITSRKQSEELLISAREEAEESKRLKQKFLANMSHEIRTPMNGVIGIVHLLERTNLNLDQKKYLNILRDSSEHLLHIINDILDVSKIEEGKLHLVESPVQLEIIIEGVIQNLKSRIRDKNLELDVSGLSIFDSHLLVDPVRIRQILLNLLSNAIKFTHKGKISVRCKNVKETVVYQKFKIEISDTGIGIPKDRLENIFDAFDQISLDTTSQYGGTGLGLNIVMDLIEKMNGKIEVKSKEGKGSSFIITLKLDKVEKELSPFDYSDFNVKKKDTLKGQTILVADDHLVNFTIAKEIISVWGADILYAKDGEEAIGKVIDDNIDLILMDMQMPNIDGIEATKMIRLLDEPKSSLPIIAMTAAALPEERERCLQSGMNDYISKPYNPSMLYEILSNYLLDDSLKEKLPRTLQKSNEKLLLDLNYLRELSGNSTKFILDMVTAFCNDMPEIVEELFQCIENADYVRISELAHKSKSMASYMGSEGLRKVFLEIEDLSESKGDLKELKKYADKASSLTINIIVELNTVEL